MRLEAAAARSKTTTLQYMISPMCKPGDGHVEQNPHHVMYGGADALGEGLLPSNGGRRVAISSISPPKMLMHHLGTGQAPIGTPLRSRVDSQESRLGVFPSLKVDESLLSGKPDP